MFEDSLRSVIKMLVKIPIMIVCMYLCFNIIAFISCYYRVMGASYSLQQIAMENNYIPDAELAAFKKYLNSTICYTTDDGAHSFTPYAHVVIFTEGVDEDPDKYFYRKNSDSFVQLFSNFGNGQNYSDSMKVTSQSSYDSKYFETNKNVRKQYGTTIYVGVATDFQAMWPLRYDQITTTDGGGVLGWEDGIGLNSDSMNGSTKESGQTGIISESQAKTRRASSNSMSHIDVVVPVVGLQYYSDLESGLD